MVSGMDKGKGKVTDDGGKGKRKWSSGDDKTGGKRRNRGVVQFFDDEAYHGEEEDEESSDGGGSWDFVSGNFDCREQALENEGRDEFYANRFCFQCCICLFMRFLGELGKMWLSQAYCASRVFFFWSRFMFGLHVRCCKGTGE